MTPEAALAKLSYLLAKRDLTLEQRREVSLCVYVLTFFVSLF